MPTQQPEDEEGEIDELLKEVQKELHTRFKNMFEGEMLLPNLANNPEFEASNKANLLSLEDGEKLNNSYEDDGDHEEAPMSHDHLLSLAQSANWLHGRSMWNPKGQQTSYSNMAYDTTYHNDDHSSYLQ